MVTIISRKTGTEKINKLLASISNKEKYLKASKYSGKLKLKETPLTIQKKLRNEWN
ncbi:hypothetical protein BMS3Abin03_00609 [bacterium BMS3Abin03]|nr:hypothetical protein BMS3Abin03_00609 [bacterium BMS3Abin03]